MEDPVYSCHRYTKKINCLSRHWWKTKSKKSAKWITTVQCTQKPRGMTLRNHTNLMANRINSVPWMHTVTSTPYHEWTRSHQLRTMNERDHINSVPWMNAVTQTPYHEWRRSHQLRTMTARSLSIPSSHFNSDQLRTVMVRSWCDSGHSWYGVDAIW